MNLVNVTRNLFSSLEKIRFDSPLATINTNVEMTLEQDNNCRKDYELSVSQKVHEYQKYQLHLVKLERNRIMSMVKEHQELLFAFDKLPHSAYIQTKNSVNQNRTKIRWQLWHAQLGHQLDNAMTTASKYIDGVPQFPHSDPILDACITCIQAKQTKNAATGTT